MTKENERIIRNARLAERQRRNNAWDQEAELAPRQTDEEIIEGERTKREYERIMAALAGL